MKKFKNKELLKRAIVYLFIFSLGFICPISVDVSKIIMSIGTLVLWIMYKKEIPSIFQLNKTYFLGLQAFVGYILLLIIAGLLFIKSPYKPTFSDIEMMLTFYTLFPLFVLLLSIEMTKKMLLQILAIFCISIAINGIVVLFMIYGFKEFLIHPIDFLIEASGHRFTGGQEQPILGHFIFLKDYSLYFGIGALIAFYLFVLSKKIYEKTGFVIVFFLNLLFLLLTVNRGSIVGIGFAMIPLLYWLLKRQSLYGRIIYVTILLLFVGFFVMNLPSSVTSRFDEIPTETMAFVQEGDGSRSVSIRLTIWKIIFSHAKEFWLFGNNPLYYNNVLRQYLVEAGHQDYVDNGYLSHNAYLNFLLKGGIISLLFAFFILLYPIIVMIRNKKYSFFSVAIICFFVVVGMEDHYYEGRHKAAMLLFFLFLIAFNWKKLFTIEQKKVPNE